MQTYLTAYIAAAVFFLVVDAVWLGKVAKNFFFKNLSHLMRPKVNYGAALGFYLAYIVGVVIFAVDPALLASSYQVAFVYGALFGFFCYGTYEMTNYAILRDWPVKIVVVDTVWGALLTGFAAIVGYAAATAV